MATKHLADKIREIETNIVMVISDETLSFRERTEQVEVLQARRRLAIARLVEAAEQQAA